mmetsp:Transcript_26682/g.30723  ORF Transcript_26682/g.30723 Transcript_26682/m.30723 type:complete len:152 (-) Transcript_26682:20-475(-)
MISILSKRSAAMFANPSVSRIVAPNTSRSLSAISIFDSSHCHAFGTTITTSEHELKNAVEDLGILTHEQRIKYFKVYRYDPDIENQKPYLSTYPIDVDDCGPTMLDALNKIKEEQDPGLTFRTQFLDFCKEYPLEECHSTTVLLPQCTMNS